MGKIMQLNSLQINALQKIDITEEKITELLSYMELARDENGASAPKDNTDRVSVKVYLHKEHRELLNEYCTVTNQSVSQFIRKVTLQHIKATVDNVKEARMP